MANDALEKMRALRSATQELKQTEVRTQTRPKEAVATEQQNKVVVDLQNNPVAKIMRDTQKSTDEKINELGAYLTVKDEDYASARKRFLEFETYFTNAQSQEMELSEQGIEKLIREVESDANLKIEAIVRDLATVQQDAGKLDQMLEALKLANAQGTSVAALRDAVIENDRLLAEIKAVQDSLEKLDKTKTARAGKLQEALDEKIASHQGFWNSVKRAFGEDKEIVARIEAARQSLAELEQEIELRQKNLTEKQDARNAKLEGPELTVLKTLDAVEDGFSDKIADTGRHALGLIRGARYSVEQLLLQISQRKESASDMNRTVTAAAIRNAVLQGALQKSEEISKKQSESIKARLDAKSAEIKALEGDPARRVEKNVLEAEQTEIRDLYTQAYGYLENIEHQLTTFATVTSNNTKAEAAARRYADFLFNVERTMKRLQNEALPEAAQQIELGLEIDQALKLAGAGRSVGHSIEEARKTSQRNWQRLAEVTGEIREDQLQGLGDLTNAVVETQNELLRASEGTVAHGIKVSDATRNALEAAGVLHEMLQEAIALSANAASADAASQVSSRGNPARPGGSTPAAAGSADRAPSAQG